MSEVVVGGVPRYPGPPRGGADLWGCSRQGTHVLLPPPRAVGLGVRHRSHLHGPHVSVCWGPGCEGPHGGPRHWASSILTLQRGRAFTEANFLKGERIKQDIYAENYSSKRHLHPGVHHSTIYDS